MGNYSSYTLTYCPYVNNLGALQYCNSLYKSSYGSNSCCGNYYRSLSQMPRQGYVGNPLSAITPPLLLLHQQRTQAYYSNCMPQPLVYLPQSSAARSSQRWTPFLKPTSTLSYHPTNQQQQHWTTYTRTTNNSTTNRSPKKPSTTNNNNNITNNTNEDKSRRSSSSSLSPTASEENLAKATASLTGVATPTEPEHPLRASVSVDLERQAMEQYRSSNENFYRQLRMAACEQEEQGNWPGPPNDAALFGGPSAVARKVRSLAGRATCDLWTGCCRKLSFL